MDAVMRIIAPDATALDNAVGSAAGSESIPANTPDIHRDMTAGLLVGFVALMGSYLMASVQLFRHHRLGEGVSMSHRAIGSLLLFMCRAADLCVMPVEYLTDLRGHFQNGWVAVFTLLLLYGTKRHGFAYFMVTDLFSAAVAVLLEGWNEALVSVLFMYIFVLVVYRVHGVRVVRLMRRPVMLSVFTLHWFGVLVYALTAGVVPDPLPIWLWMITVNISVVVLLSATRQIFYRRRDDDAIQHATLFRSIFTFTDDVSFSNLLHWSDVREDITTTPPRSSDIDQQREATPAPQAQQLRDDKNKQTDAKKDEKERTESSAKRVRLFFLHVRGRVLANPADDDRVSDTLPQSEQTPSGPLRPHTPPSSSLREPCPPSPKPTRRRTSPIAIPSPPRRPLPSFWGGPPPPPPPPPADDSSSEDEPPSPQRKRKQRRPAASWYGQTQ